MTATHPVAGFFDSMYQAGDGVVVGGQFCLARHIENDGLF